MCGNRAAGRNDARERGREGMSVDDQDDDRQCGAKTRSGRPCRAAPMAGQVRCRMHGGAAPQARAAAERRLVRAEADALVTRLLHDPDAPPVTDPLSELTRVAGRLGHAVDVLGARVNALGEQLDYMDGTAVRRAHVVVEAWRDLSAQYQRVLVDMARLDIDGRLVRLADEQARPVVSAFVAAFDALAASVPAVAAYRELAQRTFVTALRVGVREPARLGELPAGGVG